MSSDKRIPIDGFCWRPEDLLERMRSPELPLEEFWRCMSYALFVMREDVEYLSALNEVKKQRTSFAFPQQEATTPQNELPDAPPRVARIDFGGKLPKVFHDNLNEAQIASALLRIDKRGLGPKQFMLSAQEFFGNIGWLTIPIVDTHFIGWMKGKKIVTKVADNLQHVTSNETMEQLKAIMKDTFQFRNPNHVWEDRDIYYKKDSAGNTLRKINNGQ